MIIKRKHNVVISHVEKWTIQRATSRERIALQRVSKKTSCSDVRKSSNSMLNYRYECEERRDQVIGL